MEPTEDALAGLLHGTKWPLLECANGKADQKTISKFEKLNRTEEWDGLPQHACTLQMTHLIFRMVSRGAAYHEEYFTIPHTLPPFSLLKPLDSIVQEEQH